MGRVRAARRNLRRGSTRRGARYGEDRRCKDEGPPDGEECDLPALKSDAATGSAANRSAHTSGSTNACARTRPSSAHNSRSSWRRASRPTLVTHRTIIEASARRRMRQHKRVTDTVVLHRALRNACKAMAKLWPSYATGGNLQAVNRSGCAPRARCPCSPRPLGLCRPQPSSPAELHRDERQMATLPSRRTVTRSGQRAKGSKQMPEPDWLRATCRTPSRHVVRAFMFQWPSGSARRSFHNLFSGLFPLPEDRVAILCAVEIDYLCMLSRTHKRLCLCTRRVTRKNTLRGPPTYGTPG